MYFKKHIKADLHVHSCLSPCAHEDMVPSKVIQKAYEEGLDLIAITDHNSTLNIEAFVKASAQLKPNSVEIIPGIEVQSQEEIHMVCLFEDVHLAGSFQKYVDEHLPKIKNRTELFGMQVIIDNNDRVKALEERLLLNSLDLSVGQIVCKTKQLGGIAIAAHINRPAYSILSLLGFIPEDLKIDALELSANVKIEDYLKKINFNKFPVICSSDAHYLNDIGKAYSYFEGEASFSSLKEALKLYKVKRFFQRR